MIKNIILDVGGVLVAWEPEAALQRLGFDEETTRAVAQATVRSQDWNEMDRSALDAGELLAGFIQKAPEYEAEIRLMWDNIDMQVAPYDYSRTWIRSMKRNGYRVYILSNYSRWTYEHTTEALSFLEDVDGALFSFEVRQVKPEPEIYQSLLTRYGLKPEECLFLDDRQENIDAAAAQGIAGIRFTTYAETVRALQEYGVNWREE